MNRDNVHFDLLCKTTLMLLSLHKFSNDMDVRKRIYANLRRPYLYIKPDLLEHNAIGLCYIRPVDYFVLETSFIVSLGEKLKAEISKFVPGLDISLTFLPEKFHLEMPLQIYENLDFITRDLHSKESYFDLLTPGLNPTDINEEAYWRYIVNMLISLSTTPLITSLKRKNLCFIKDAFIPEVLEKLQEDGMLVWGKKTDPWIRFTDAGYKKACDLKKLIYPGSDKNDRSAGISESL